MKIPKRPKSEKVDKAATASLEKEKFKLTAYIPLEDADELRMHALTHRITTSELITSLVQEFLSDLRAKP